MHMRTLEALPQVRTVHLCGIEGEDNSALAQGTSKVESSTDRLDDLLQRPDLDALMVSVRNDLSPGVLTAALECGLPVLFEKPGAVHADDLRRVALEARKRGVAMGAMYTSRWRSSTREIRELVKAGALGRVMAVEVRIVTSQVKYRDPDHWLFKEELAGGGILSWLACHQIDLLAICLSRE